MLWETRACNAQEIGQSAGGSFLEFPAGEADGVGLWVKKLLR
jgi:hypothetical protein